MAAVTEVQNSKKVQKIPVPTDIQDRIDRARKAMRRDAAKRRLCVKFWQGEPYWYIDTKGALSLLPTALVDTSGRKPAHRIRNTYNYVQTVVEAKVSAASQRVPGYEIDPSSSDQDDIAEARIAQQIAFFGYDKWRLRRMTTKVITNAIVQREGFAMPYFDPNVGPYTTGPDGTVEGQGEIRVRVFNRSEVGWEPGEDLEDSPFYITEEAVTEEEIRAIPGFIGVSLGPDASTTDLPSEARQNRTLLTTYYERPTTKYPLGRKCFIAAGGIVVDYRKDPAAHEGADWYEPYPMVNFDGLVVDEPCIHRLSYTVNVDGDDMGLVERIIDLQRTINDCWNKLLEWKNRALMPQMSAPRGSNVTRRDDTPGATWYYNVIGGQKPEWEPTPRVPQELFQMLQEAKNDLRELAADVNAAPDPNLAAATLNASIEQNQARWQSFLGDVAEFHSRFMRHCLMLVQRYYTDERVIQIRGQYGWEPAITFRGQDIASEKHVRVLPGSLETKTRQQIMQTLTFMQTNWPGAIAPEAAMAAINGGTGEGLLESYTRDVEAAWRVVQTFRQGPDVVLNLPMRNDPELGPVPSWMPRPWDNVAIFKQVLSDYLKSDDYTRLDAPTQELFNLFWSGLEWLEGAKAQQLAMREQGSAAMLGMQNAAKPQGQIALPQGQGPMTPQQAAPAAMSQR